MSRIRVGRRLKGPGLLGHGATLVAGGCVPRQLKTRADARCVAEQWGENADLSRLLDWTIGAFRALEDKSWLFGLAVGHVPAPCAGPFQADPRSVGPVQATKIRSPSLDPCAYEPDVFEGSGLVVFPLLGGPEPGRPDLLRDRAESLFQANGAERVAVCARARFVPKDAPPDAKGRPMLIAFASDGRRSVCRKFAITEMDGLPPIYAVVDAGQGSHRRYAEEIGWVSEPTEFLVPPNGEADEDERSGVRFVLMGGTGVPDGAADWNGPASLGVPDEGFGE